MKNKYNILLVLILTISCSQKQSSNIVFCEIDFLNLKGVKYLRDLKSFPQYKIENIDNNTKKMIIFYSNDEIDTITYKKGKKYWYNYTKDPGSLDYEIYFLEILQKNQSINFCYKIINNKKFEIISIYIEKQFETQGMDFKDLIVPSFSENNFPKVDYILKIKNPSVISKKKYTIVSKNIIYVESFVINKINNKILIEKRDVFNLKGMNYGKKTWWPLFGFSTIKPIY